MILGSGLIAGLFSDMDIPDEILIHAAGVSNSSCTSASEFRRDHNLVAQSLETNKKVIYFSSQGCSDSSTANAYYIHKRSIEKVILESSSRNVVVRLPQVSSRLGNPNNLINVFYNNLRSGDLITCFARVKRNLIKDVHLKYVYNNLISDDLKGLLSFCSPYDYTPLEILNAMEKVSALTANLSVVDYEKEVTESAVFSCSEEFHVLRKRVFTPFRDQYLIEVIHHALY